MEQNNIPADVQNAAKWNPNDKERNATIYAGNVITLLGALIKNISSGCNYQSIELDYKSAVYHFDKLGKTLGLQQWKDRKEVELTCMVCGSKFMGPEPKMCCNGRDCGCMGLPTEPIVCSKECYEKGIPPQKGDSEVAIEID